MSPGRIALGYAVIAILWIAFSDAIVTHFKLHPFMMTIKGGVFVFVTTWLLYFTTRRLVHALSRLNRELRAISDCNQSLLHCTDEQSLLEKICRLCKEAGYGMAWVAYAEHDEARSVRPVAWAGADEAYLTAAGISWSEDSERGRGPTGTAIRSGKTCCIQDFATDTRVAPWRDLLLQGGFRSALALPLKDDHGRVFGTLTMHSERRNAFTPEEIHLLEELAGDLAFGIVTLRSRAARECAERELALLGFALDNVREAAFLSDEQGLFRYANQQACRILGYPRAELLRMGIPDIDPEFPAECWDDHWRELRAKMSLSFESRHRTRDGRLLPVEVSANYFEYGGRAYNLALARDITERKQAEQALRESETNLNRAQEIAHIGSWHLDVARNRLDWSDEVFRIFGVPLGKALTYEAFLDMVHPGDRGFVHSSWSAALEGAPYDIEHRIVVSGELKWVRERAQVEFSQEGKPTSGIGIVQDITERKRAEEALRESETRFRSFVDHAGDSLAVLDYEEGTIVDINRQACESLGYTREELIGKTSLSFHLEADRGNLESAAARAAAGETVFDRHYHRRKDGSLFPVEANTSAFWYGGRRFLLKVARDISDRVRAEEDRDRLRQLEADLAHIDRVSMLGELAASIAHEVNQPLSGIVSNGSACLRWLAADSPNLEEVREAVRDIVRDGKRAGEVIARIRALTKKTAPAKKRLDLNQIIGEVLALVADETKRKRVITKTRLKPDLSPVLGDQVQLQQVALNLILNAIEAMSSVSERARELVIATREAEPDQVQVTVQDSGVGIDAEKIGKVFDSFYTTKPGGMGMGLSISRSILQAHGGRLWATANDGPGATFQFTLPKYREEEARSEVATV